MKSKEIKQLEQKIYDLALKSAKDPTLQEYYNILPHLVNEYIDKSKSQVISAFPYKEKSTFGVEGGSITVVKSNALISKEWQLRYMDNQRGRATMSTSVNWRQGSTDRFTSGSKSHRFPISNTARFERKLFLDFEYNTIHF